jgi:hypothetical protein
VTENHNVLTYQMKVKKNVASKNSTSTTLKFVAATQIPNGPVVTVTASRILNTVMAKLNVLMDPTKETLSAASKI